MGYAIDSLRQVGSTSLLVPPFGMGTVPVAEFFELVEEERAFATFQSSWMAGVSLYDTAPWYGRGLGEHRLGGFLRTKLRSEFTIMTKVGRYAVRPESPRTFNTRPWVGGLRMEMIYDYTYDGVMRSYEQSLLRLGLDTVDALLIHDPDPSYHAERHASRMRDMAVSGIRALEALRDTGQIRAMGVGLSDPESLVTLASMVPLDFCIVALSYDLLD